MDPDECPHENINEHGWCSDCFLKVGLQFEMEDEGYHKITVTPGGSLETNIGNAPPEVMKIFRRLEEEQRLRGNKIRNDKKNSFILLYIAYNISGVEYNPLLLAKSFGFSRVHLNGCINNVSGSSLNPKIDVGEFRDKIPSIVLIKPQAFVESICENSGIMEYKDEIRQISIDFIEEYPEFIRYRPQHIACAITNNFCERNDIPLKQFTKINGITDGNLKALCVRLKDKGY